MKVQVSLDLLLVKLNIHFVLQGPNSLGWIPLLWNLGSYFSHGCCCPTSSTSARAIATRRCEGWLNMVILSSTSHHLNWILACSICPIQSIGKSILLWTCCTWGGVTSILGLNIPLIVSAWLQTLCGLGSLGKRCLFVWTIGYVSIMLFRKYICRRSFVLTADLTTFCTVKSNKVQLWIRKIEVVLHSFSHYVVDPINNFFLWRFICVICSMHLIFSARWLRRISRQRDLLLSGNFFKFWKTPISFSLISTSSNPIPITASAVVPSMSCQTSHWL
jgi:hypothetical protein